VGLSQELVNFHRLDPQRLLGSLDLVLSQMNRPRCSGRILALNSLENRVYLVQLEDDSEVVAKFYRPARWSQDQIREEHSLLRLALEAEIPVVAPLAVEPGHRSLFSAPEGISFALFPKVRGRLTSELSPEQAKVLGRYLGRLHRLTASLPQSCRPALDLGTFGDDALDTLEAHHPDPSPQLQRYLRVAEEFLDLVDPLLSESLALRAQIVHGDCHVGNVLWQGEAPFLLDFDDMTTCLPVQDLWLVAPGRDDESLVIREALLEGYRAFSVFDEDDFVFVEPLRGLRMIHYNAWVAKRWSDPVFPATFVQFGTDRHWQEECQALAESMEIVRGMA
jgi:Ser/Thr protein kinase RdoA (MazF antagonist)